MSEFEFLFGLFGLLLGFILVEVLSGLMRTLQARLPSGPGIKAEIHIGWLTPMLGAFTMLNVLLMWGTIWNLQNKLSLGFDTTTLGLILCSFYYFAASMIFPDEPRVWPDIDEWFWMHRRQVLGCIFAANLPGIFSTYFVEKLTPSQLIVSSVVNALLAGMLLLAILASKRWLVTTALGVLIAVHLSFIPLEILARHGIW